MDMRTPLSRARGSGSARDGVEIWKMERVTAAALVPLCLWFLIFLIRLSQGNGYETYVEMISTPGNTALMLLFIYCAFYHGMLGLSVVVEDYISRVSTRYLLLAGTKMMMVFLGLFCMVSVLKVAIGK